MPILNIQHGENFLKVLAKWVLEKFYDPNNPELIANTQLILPYRRAVREFQKIYLAESGSNSIICPKLRAVDDIDITELILNSNNDPDLLSCLLKLSPSVNEIKRKILLSNLIKELKVNINEHVNEEVSLNLAETLGMFLDDVYKEQCDWKNLKNIVSPDLAEHWQITLDFLYIISNSWPDKLKEIGSIDKIDRRNHLVDMQTEAWKKYSSKYPVILAGSTGSQMSTKKLLKAIAELKNGYVIFHSQSADNDNHEFEKPYQELISYINIKPEDIKQITKQMQPAQNIAIFEANSLSEEAEFVSEIVRKELDKGKTINIITTENATSCRIRSCLEKWQIYCDSSHGEEIVHTAYCQFLFQIIDFITSDFKPIPTLALLKNSQLNLYHKDELSELLESKFYSHPLRNKDILYISENIEPKYAATLNILFSKFSKLQNILQSKNTDLYRIFYELFSLADELTNIEYLNDTNQLEVKTIIENLIEDTKDIKISDPKLNFKNIFNNLLKSIQYHPKRAFHPKVKILTPIEARLLDADITIITSLNEGSFPKINKNYWMSKKMQSDFGLVTEEQHIELSALDFNILTSKGEVYLTRSIKDNGNPTIESRFLVKLLSEKKNIKILRKANYLSVNKKNIYPPAPSPALELRPKEFSASDVELWMSNPYGVYAKKILGLRKNEQIDKEPDRTEFGTLLHSILAKFISGIEPDRWPINDKIIMSEIIDNNLKSIPLQISALWKNKLILIAEKFIIYEKFRWNLLRKVDCEYKQYYSYGDFIINSRADRINYYKDGVIEIIDYKSGSIPEKADLKSGKKSQVTVEALSLNNNASFLLNYWKISIKEKNLKINVDKSTEYLKSAEEGIKKLLDSYNKADQSYFCFSELEDKNFDDYRHLSRIQEWG